MMEYYKLNNGVEIPMIGFGTYFINVSDTYNAVYTALNSGYRHLDTAKWYVNETEVARAINDSGINRKELFITCKVESKGYMNTIRDIEDTLNKFGTDYLDLILIHWPEGNVLETYKALEEMYDKGFARAIGLSNFNEELTDYILNNCQIKPQVNQIETHIYFQEQKMSNYLSKNSICHEAWSPFAEGTLDVFNDQVICKIAKKYNKTPSQIMLRYFIQKKIVVIPKSTNPLHIKENLEVFDFKLDDEDMQLIEQLDKRKQLSDWPQIMKCETKY